MDSEDLKQILDDPGEIWDIPELCESDFNIEEHINGTTEY